MREGYLVCVSVGLSVCPSVIALSASASTYTCNQLYSRVSLRIFRGKNSIQKLWCEKGNMHHEPFSCTLWTSEGQQLREG